MYSGNKLLQNGSITFYSDAGPGLFYTEMGTYSEEYYKRYEMPDGTEIPAKDYLARADYIRLIPYYGSNTGVQHKKSLDIICAVPGQKGAYVIYSIADEQIRDLLSREMYAPEQTILMAGDGQVIYPLVNEIHEDIELLEELINTDRNHVARQIDASHKLISAR